MDVPFLLGKPITAWASIATGSLALVLLSIAILQMSRRISIPISHQRVGYTALAIIGLHALIGFVARFILGL